MGFAAHTWSWGLSIMPLIMPAGQESTQYCFLFLFLLRANFWANAQAIKAGCRSNDQLKLLHVTVMLRSPLYQ